MEKHLKKPDWTEVIAISDLYDYFKIAEDDHFKVVRSEDDLNELFDLELKKYKSEVNRDEVPEFIDIQIEKITGMIEKVKTVKDYSKFNEYRNAIFYLKYLHNKQSEEVDSGSLNYVLKNESVIIKLYEMFGSSFPDETKEIWKKRWTTGNDVLLPIKTNEFKNGNNKHLLLTILHEADRFIKVPKIEDYIYRRWGLKFYHSVISKYITHQDAITHPQRQKIEEILKPELF